MGYVFDAMQQTPDDDAPRPDPQASDLTSPAPAPPPHLEPQAEDEPAPAPLRIGPITPTEVDASHFDDRLVAATDPASRAAEEYRAIRTSLLARWEHRNHLVHTITSATPQEGKTITSMNLGLSFAELRHCKALVVEADLRLPTFDKLLHTGPHAGLIDYLRGEAALDQVIQPLGDLPLHVIGAGSSTQSEAVQLLSSPRLTQLMAELRRRYDHVIVDTPPVIELADAGIVGSQSDDVLLVARMNRTPRPLVEQAIRTLQSYHAPVAGAIATDETAHRHGYYYYRYGYHYRYSGKRRTRRAA